MRMSYVGVGGIPVVVLQYSIDIVPVYICMSAASIALHFSLGTYMYIKWTGLLTMK